MVPWSRVELDGRSAEKKNFDALYIQVHLDQDVRVRLYSLPFTRLPSRGGAVALQCSAIRGTWEAKRGHDGSLADGKVLFVPRRFGSH